MKNERGEGLERALFQHSSAPAASSYLRRPFYKPESILFKIYDTAEKIQRTR